MSGAVAHVQEAPESPEGDFAVGLAVGSEMRLFDKVERVAVSVVNLDDAPQANKGLGEAEQLGHQPVSAINLSSRTRL